MELTSKQIKNIAEKAAEIIFSNEGGYGSVNKNDNGAVSVGKVQWHGNRALNLLKTIVKLDHSVAQTLLGITLYNEITEKKDWSNRIVTATEASCLSKFLSSKAGKQAQDELAISDVTTYVNKGISYGLVNDKALIYLADALNQYGTASSLWKNITVAAIAKDGGTLESMYSCTTLKTSNYLTRRKKVYTALKSATINITQQQSTVAEPVASSIKAGDQVTVNGIVYANGNGGSFVKVVKQTMYVTQVLGSGYKYQIGVSKKKGGTRYGWASKTIVSKQFIS